MKNSDYWKERFTQLEAAQNQKGAAAYLEIEQLYRQAEKEIEGSISTWYQRFASNNGVSMAEARKLLSGNALKEFKWDVNDYIQHGRENAIDGRWMKELENASARFHITRLEALKLQTQQSLELMFGNQLDRIDSAMKHIYLGGYYHTAYELQKGFGIGWDIAGLDQAQIEKVIRKPWTADGKNFSERIWNNKQTLISELHKELTQNIMLGQDPQKAIDAIAKKMNTSKRNAGRLVMTEEAYFSSAAQKDCFHDLDVEQYEIVATLDSHTSDLCRNMDGKVFPMKDFEAGVTAPPFHVWCRSTTVPHFDEDFGQIGKRAARNKEGKTYYVPADMKYSDWKKNYVDNKIDLNEVSKDVIIKTDNYVFIEAKTIREANEYAQKVLGVKANYKGCDIKSANEWNKGVTEYFNQFEELKYNLGFIGDARQRNQECKKLVYEDAFEKLKKLNPNGSEELLKKYAKKQANAFVRKMRVSKNTFAQSWAPEGLLEEYRGICLNSDWGKNSDIWIQELINNVESKFHPTGCDTIRSVLDHEMGHQLNKLLNISEIKKVRNLFDTRNLDELTNDISEYSWNNNNPDLYDEMIAEAWSEYCNNPNPREIAQTVGEIIKDEYNEYMKRMNEAKELGLR